MSNFYLQMVEVVRAARQHANAFTDVAQSTVYVRTTDEGEQTEQREVASHKGWIDRGPKDRKAEAVGAWFAEVKAELGSAVTSAEKALEMRWESLRDERQKTPEAAEQFMKVFEARVQSFADVVAKISKGVEDGKIRKTPAVDKKLQGLREDVNHMIALYDQEGVAYNLPTVRRSFRGPGSGFNLR